MKPTIFDRILLVFLMLIGVAMGIVFLFIAINFVTVDMLSLVFALPYGSVFNHILTGVIGLLLLIFSFRIMIAFNRGKGKGPAAASAVIAHNELGTSRITLAAIDAMVQRHCRANPVVADCNSLIATKANAVSVNLKVVLTDEANVAETTAGLQNSLREYIQSLTGIAVNDISILVVSAPTPGLKKY